MIKEQFRLLFRPSIGKAVIAALFFSLSTTANNDTAIERLHQIIPQPVKMEVVKGKNFILSAKTPIYYTTDVKAQAEYLQETLAGSTGFDLTLKEV